MRNFLLGVATTLLLLAAAAAYVWYYDPARLPAEWRRANPRSIEYRPALYRWKDAAGVVQVTDRPPPDRPYETLRIDPGTNVVPLAPERND